MTKGSPRVTVGLFLHSAFTESGRPETILSAWHALVMFRSKTRGSPSIPQQVLAYTITPLSIELNPCAWKAHTFHYPFLSGERTVWPWHIRSNRPSTNNSLGPAPAHWINSPPTARLFLDPGLCPRGPVDAESHRRLHTSRSITLPHLARTSSNSPRPARRRRQREKGADWCGVVACGDSLLESSPVSSGGSLQDRRLRQDVHIGSDHRRPRSKIRRP